MCREKKTQKPDPTLNESMKKHTTSEKRTVSGLYWTRVGMLRLSANHTGGRRASSEEATQQDGNLGAVGLLF